MQDGALNPCIECAYCIGGLRREMLFSQVLQRGRSVEAPQLLSFGVSQLQPTELDRNVLP